ncbi:MAG: AroM family protein, partial [Dysosmobacter sp.]
MPLIYPSKVICNVVATLGNLSRIGIITPEEAQIEDIQKSGGPLWRQ